MDSAQQKNQAHQIEEDKFSTADESGVSMIETGKDVR